MEGDLYISSVIKSCGAFQSTPSAWRETFYQCACGIVGENFNPLPPHGGRPIPSLVQHILITFQSTPSAWRETPWYAINCFSRVISIHSLRMEGDQSIVHVAERLKLFQSTPSAWRETIYAHIPFTLIYISIHSLRMEGDSHQNTLPKSWNLFQSTPSAWRETHKTIFQ